MAFTRWVGVHANILCKTRILELHLQRSVWWKPTVWILFFYISITYLMLVPIFPGYDLSPSD